jgi:transcriptional regulator with XRE-family HTH domain
MEIKNLKQLRENVGLTQSQVADKLNVTITYVSLLETADRNPSDNIKEQLAELYNVTIGTIYSAIKLTKCQKERR